MVRVALVGCGGWGRNLLRVLLESPRASVVAIAEPHPLRHAMAEALALATPVVSTLDEALAHEPDAIVIATPPHSHAAIAMEALSAGADVFVEKPLATRTADAERLAEKASELGRIAMVGHLLRYHPTVCRLVDLASSGALGPLRRFEARRLSVAGDRSASAIWTLGPHDFSVLRAIDPSPPKRLSTRMGPSGDPIAIEAELASGLEVSITLSRVSASKERHLRVIGAAHAAEIDDVAAPDRVLVDGEPQIVAWHEPLANEIDHFLRCVIDRSRPRTSFEEGVDVVRALFDAEESAMPPLGTAQAAIPRL
jgi:predicted dehydrogenase